MPITLQDMVVTGPLTIVSIASLVVVTIQSIKDKSEEINLWISILGLLAAVGVASTTLGTTGKAYAEMVRTGGFADFFGIVFCLAGLITLMLSKSYIQRQGIEHGEFYSLLLLAVVGMMLMAAAADLIVLFLGLELMSVSFYIMAGLQRKRLASNEAALKYFLLGAFATGFLLYGIALMYGATSTTNIESITSRLSVVSESTTFVIGVGLLFVGLVFKIAAVPFHMWVPDVYEGAPTTVSAFMSTGGKAAAFSAVLLIFAPTMVEAIPSIREIMALVAALSMVLGNVIAISQNNIKRMLAYSSIAHAGYILTGVVAGNAYGYNGVLFYLVAYTAMNVGAFGVLSMLESSDGQNLTFDDYAGLSAKKPVLAGLMALFMFSLTGIPPFAGFFGKYYVFAGAIQGGYTWLAIVGVLMSVVSAYYYLRLVVLMYFKDQPSLMEMPSTRLDVAALVIPAIALVVFGVFPSTILDLIAYFA
ncbi:MAG: NADH-quinone oxidoreductase subunit N [Ignavibacteriae bacterium]|nr:NADH-quinone oxidoreductase subunit N [Ignavibacteriota bacterium]